MSRQARALDVFLAEINRAAPGRDKSADGGIGDAAHASRDSDHNPNAAGVWRARDVTHDPEGGMDCNELADDLADLLRAGTHPALGSGAYVIWDGRILSRDRLAEGWRHYKGSNPHRHHLHLSVATAAAGYDSTKPWELHMDDRPTYTRGRVVDAVLAHTDFGVRNLEGLLDRTKDASVTEHATKALEGLRSASWQLRQIPRRPA